MNIAGTQAWAVSYTEPNDHDSTRYSVMVRLTAEDGHVGWGEAVTIFREAALATAVLANGLAELIVGAPARSPAALHQRVKERAWWYGEGGLASFALSAIDMAAWDLAGHISNLSVVELLGGAVHESLPVVVTSHATLSDLQGQAELFARWSDELGAIGVKVGFGKQGGANLGFDHERDVKFVRLLRAALGERALVMIDLGARIRWDVAAAVRRTLAFEEHGLHWIEEPLGADDPEGYVTLRAKTTALIAYGEREWTLRGIRRIVKTGTVDVVGIDSGRAEGITGFAAACRYIEAEKRQANAHAFAGPLSYAAGLAVSLTSPACRQFEVAPLVNSFVRDVAPGLPRPTGGVVGPLPGDGLGVDVDFDAVVSAVVS
jgi:L-alanine-DL-glutamate epimerase-like enolase superfamily enzyme